MEENEQIIREIKTNKSNKLNIKTFNPEPELTAVWIKLYFSSVFTFQFNSNLQKHQKVKQRKLSR